MELSFLSRALFFSLLLTILSPFSSSTFISDGVFQSQELVTGRNLLQAKKPCSVNFESMNYTVITDKCKAPKYPVKECCSSLKDFACSYAHQLNDFSTNCARTMFSYIRIYGKYPPGLFASECRDGKKGLECPAMPPNSVADINPATAIACSNVWMTISAALLVVLKLL